MDSNTDTQATDSDAATAFQDALEALVLGSFTDGAPVEGRWDITLPVADAPDWTVTIEKTYSEDTAPHRPTLLEE